MTERRVEICLYADVDLSLIDGSSIWARSLVSTLLQGKRNRVTLLSRKPDLRGLVLGNLPQSDRLDVPLPNGEKLLGPERVLDQIIRLDEKQQFDVVIVRGRDVAAEAATSEKLDGRLWLYYLPPKDGEIDSGESSWLEEVGSASKHVLCQTEAVRAYVEASVPELSSKLILLPPMIPGIAETPPRPRPRGDRPLNVVYAGKLAPEYRFLDLVEVVRRLRKQGTEAVLTVAGDKIHDPQDQPDFRERAIEALEREDFIDYLGGVDRDALQNVLSRADVALSLRTRALDASLEMSTKVLEYGGAGVPVVLNKTPLHEDLLGADYPLYADGIDSAVEAIESLTQRSEAAEDASRRLHRLAREHTYQGVWQQLEPYFELASPARRYVTVSERPLNVLVAGNDMKFFGTILEHFQRGGARVSVDHWSGAQKHDPNRSARLLSDADVVVCEWCTGNAVWYSQRVKPQQRLIIRLHRWEADTEYPEKVSIGAVDRVVFVSPHIRERVLEKTKWPMEKTILLNNWVDVASFHRRKLPGAEFTLGMLGWVDSRKRLDRAIDILQHVRKVDGRYRLLLKGALPWELKWTWRHPEQRAFFKEQLGRIETDPLLAGSVSFEPFGPETASWFRKTGYILSTSDDEGNQVSVTEGAASASVPVVLQREGAADTYPSWVHHDSASAAASVLGGAGRWEEERRRAQEWARSEFNPLTIASVWDDIVLGNK